MLTKHQRRTKIDEYLEEIQLLTQKAYKSLCCSSNKELCFISISSSGKEAIKIHEKNPTTPVIAITNQLNVSKKLQLFKGIKAIYFDWSLLDNNEKDIFGDKLSKNIVRSVVHYLQKFQVIGDDFCVKRLRKPIKFDEIDESSSDGSEESESSSSGAETKADINSCKTTNLSLSLSSSDSSFCGC